ncbi:DUF4352 domain-containing protein [Micromonospora echinaurantiaca]|uniref:DUF4352 domain-containing protein n=1 Tax=Micromonospora echinaurantiaca TaxID=47857 RepID=UPI0037165501
MSHPQSPYGPQDPHPQNPEQQQPYPPTAPMPQFPADQGGYPPPPPAAPQPGDPWAPLPPVSGAPQPPVSGGGDPWAAPQPPVSGTPQPPVPGQPWAPPVSGAPQPPTSGVPGAYGMPAPGAPGYPLGAPQPVAPNGGKKKKTVLIIAIAAVVLTLLCCVGGIAAIVAGADKAADEVAEALPTPLTTGAPGLPSGAPSASAGGETDGETFNMKPGDTLVLSDNEGTVEITVTKFTTATKGCRSYAPKPDKGLYLIAHVTATVTKGKGSINPFYFEWVASDGTTVNGLASALSGCGDTLSSGNNLRAGSKRTGTVVFDVADKNGALEYQHRFEAAGSWKP